MYYLLLILYTQKSKIEKDILLKNLIAYQVVEAWNSWHTPQIIFLYV